MLQGLLLIIQLVLRRIRRILIILCIIILHIRLSRIVLRLLRCVCAACVWVFRARTELVWTHLAVLCAENNEDNLTYKWNKGKENIRPILAGVLKSSYEYSQTRDNICEGPSRRNNISQNRNKHKQRCAPEIKRFIRKTYQ